MNESLSACEMSSEVDEAFTNMQKYHSVTFLWDFF